MSTLYGVGDIRNKGLAKWYRETARVQRILVQFFFIFLEDVQVKNKAVNIPGCNIHSYDGCQTLIV